MDARQREIAKGLFKLAWADGEVIQQEVDVISNLLERLGIPALERLAMMDECLGEDKGEEPQLDMLQSQESRMEALGMLVQLCFADDSVVSTEAQIVADLALRWGVDAAQLEQLRVQGA